MIVLSKITEFIPYVPAILIPIAYWKQAYHIHQHKEVRDLDLSSFYMLAISYVIFLFEALRIDSTVFTIKNALAFVPVVVVCWQINKHKGDEWHDDDNTFCHECGNELETHWKCCTDCGTAVSNRQSIDKGDIDGE